MKSRLWSFCLVFWFAVCGVFLAFSGAHAEEAAELGEVVVTATRTETSPEDVPASVSIITKKDLERKRLVTIDKALEHEAGVYVRRNKGLMDAMASVSLRGLPYQKRTLVLLDGMPVNDALAGSIRWSNLSTYSIKRIEVVRGAYSALWGGNAMGGVISLFTDLPKELTYWAKAGLGGEESVTQGYRLGLGNRVNNISFLVGFEKDIDHGYITRLVTKSPSKRVSGPATLEGGYIIQPALDDIDYVVGDCGKNWGRRENYNAALGWAFSDNSFLKLSFQHGWSSYGYGYPNTYLYDKTTGEPSFSGIIEFPDGKFAKVEPSDYLGGIGRSQIDLLVFNVKNEFQKSRLNFTLGGLKKKNYYTTAGDGDYYTADGEFNESKADTVYTDLSGSLNLLANHLLTLGITYRLDKVNIREYELSFYRNPNSKLDEIYRSGGHIGNLGLFVQDRWAIKENLTLFLGLRYDHWWTYNGYSSLEGSYPSRNTGTFSPKIGLVKKLSQHTTLKLSYGKAFRPPNVRELYRTFTFMRRTYYSNPYLDPEIAYTKEISLSHIAWNNRLKFDLNLYHTALNDLIYRKPIEGTRDKIYINAGEGEVYGIEVGTKAKVTSWLNVGINYTRNDTKITSNTADPTSEGKRFISIPPWMWNFHIGIFSAKARLDLYGRYVGKIYTEEDNSDIFEGVYGTYEKYFVVDLKGSVDLPKPAWLIGEKLTLSLSVNNLFDEEYFVYNRAPGRSWFLSLELKK